MHSSSYVACMSSQLYTRFVLMSYGIGGIQPGYETNYT